MIPVLPVRQVSSLWAQNRTAASLIPPLRPCSPSDHPALLPHLQPAPKLSCQQALSAPPWMAGLGSFRSPLSLTHLQPGKARLNG